MASLAAADGHRGERRQRPANPEEHDADRQRSGGPGKRHGELIRRILCLPVDFGHTAEDEETDTADRETPADRNERVSQFVKKHARKENQTTDYGADQQAFRLRPGKCLIEIQIQRPGEQPGDDEKREVGYNLNTTHRSQSNPVSHARPVSRG